MQLSDRLRGCVGGFGKIRIRGKRSMQSTRDKNGKTEEQFLREYDVTKYFRPSVTVDAVLYLPTERGGKVLLIKRGGHPFIGGWAFPGGFVEENEPCETAVARELAEETGINGVALRQLVTASTPGRDPRWRNITVVFYGVLDNTVAACGDDDAAEARWFDFECGGDDGAYTIDFSGGGDKFRAVLKVARDQFGAIDINETEITERGQTAFDHAKLVAYLYEHVKRRP